MSNTVQVGVPFVLVVNGQAKRFDIGERYEQVGEPYSIRRLCGPCGNRRMETVSMLRVLVGEHAVEAEGNWFTSPDPGVAIVGENMNDAAANFASQPTFSSSYVPEVRNDDANREAFNKMAVFDLRDGKTPERPYAHDSNGPKEEV